MPKTTPRTIQSTLNAQLFKDLGIEIESYDPTEDYKTLVKDKAISPAMCGPVGCMFKTITVTVKAGVCHKTAPVLCLIYDFRYEHSNGGTNGYDVRKEIDCTTGEKYVHVHAGFDDE